MEFENLVNQPEARRDEVWESDFLKAVVETKVELVKNQPERGPDGWPYMLVRSSAVASEPFVQLVQWVAPRGIGIALNTHKMLPDYIFTYGMLWNYVETGRFLADVASRPAGQVQLAENEKMIFGAPSEKYLPPYVRAVLREFLLAQGFSRPRVMVMSSADYLHVDLVFSLPSLNNIKESEHRTLAEAIGWFLPMHYSLIFGPETNAFVDL